jgi:hypothetical protein
MIELIPLIGNLGRGPSKAQSVVIISPNVLSIVSATFAMSQFKPSQK